MITGRPKTARWGSKVLSQLSMDLRAEFPAAKGFSPASVGMLREYLGELTDAENTASQIKDSSFVKGWVLTGEPGVR